MNFVRKVVKNHVEPVAAEVVGRIFWPPVAVTVVAHGDHDDILVLDTGEQYALPGGLLKFGEGLRDAAEREFSEETGFEVETGNLLDVRFNQRTGSIDFFFEAEVTGGEMDGSWEGNPVFVEKEKVGDVDWRLEHSHVDEYLFPE